MNLSSPSLVAAIHVFVDPRDKPAGDVKGKDRPRCIEERRASNSFCVIAALVAAIHVFMGPGDKPAG